MPRRALHDTLTSLATISVDRSADVVRRILTAVREHLDMDVCFVAEFVGGQEVVRAIDGDAASFGLEKSEGLPLVSTYCRRLLDGRLPSVVPDARFEASIADLEVTSFAGIGAFLGVPITFSNGKVVGTLVCLSHVPDPFLSGADVGFMEVLARLIGDELERRRIRSDGERLELDRIRRALEEDSVPMVFQPIVDLRDGVVVGLEALARFGSEPEHPPTTWFEGADAIGLRTDLELVAVRAALAQLSRIPPPLYLSVNVSPRTILATKFFDALSDSAPDRVVIEITEHAAVDDYMTLRGVLHRAHDLGARVAIDDTGAGMDSLANIHRLDPDGIKLDMSLTRGIDRDPMRRSLAASLVELGARIDAAITAEGIETRAEEETLRSMGVGFGQGWYVGKPAPLDEMAEEGQPLATAG